MPPASYEWERVEYKMKKKIKWLPHRSQQQTKVKEENRTKFNLKRKRRINCKKKQ
jgi:hypothetical protein